MKAWRAQLAKWPKETPRMMDPVSAPLEMRDPERLREGQRAVRAALPAILGGFGLPILAALALARSVESDAAGLLLGGTVVAFWSMVASVRLVGERLDDRRRRRETDRLEARGEATLGGEFVGIAYSNELWRHPTLGDDVDHGILRIDFDRLTFVGRDTRFELPASAVVRTEIRRFDQILTGPLPRLYVTWRDGAKEETFSVALPWRRSLARRVTAITELQERIDAWRGERRPAFGGERPFLAPPSGERLQSRQSSFQRIGRRAKLLALVAAIPIWLVAMVALILGLRAIHVDPGIFATVPMWISAVAWIFIAAKIESRLPERHRYKDPQAVLPVADLGPARSEDEAKVEQKA